jgi:dTDP-N-acetylfucosamine:lipid II N-acetylfucosaminyltransferase
MAYPSRVELVVQDFKIICPLSYGKKEHAEKIAALGQSFFGERFTPLMNFMVFDEYLKVLAKVDIAIFAHKRPQAMCNTITLLGLGKTIYMINDVTPFAFFKNLEIKVLDFYHLNISTLDVQTINKSKENVKNYFSEKKIIKQLKELFE